MSILVSSRQFKNNVILIISALLLLFSMGCFADKASLPFNNIVFFGDSLSDDGNLYHFDDGFLPESPPYYNGRFTNGPTWAELTAKNLYNIDYISSANYAVGGSTAVLHDPINGYEPYTLGMEVTDYLARNFFYSKKKTLFVIWTGSNDYLLTNSDVNGATTETVNAIRAQIVRLAYYGAHNFVIINLPDISKSPSARQRGVVQNLHELVVAHNAKLKWMLDKLQLRHPNLKIVRINVYNKFNDLLNDPEKFNQEYGTDITDVISPCWDGGYSYTSPTSAQIMAQTNQSNSSQGNLSQNNKHQTLDANQLLAAMQNSPSLQEAYMVSQAYAEGETPCSNPNNHIFWDHVHPTEAVHSIIATLITQDIIKAES